MASQKIRIKLKSLRAQPDRPVLPSGSWKPPSGPARRVSGPIPLPTEKEIVTILRAPHKYKDSREQFELPHPQAPHRHPQPQSPSTVDAMMKLELPAGVEIELKL